MSKFICPLPFKALSIEAGYRSRICCHDLTGENDEIDLELKSQLHQKVQTEMLRGKVPDNCRYCKHVEDLGGFSPRQDYMSQLPLDTNIEINYLDITIDSSCNLSCRMCTPHYSAPLEKTFKELNIPLDEKFLSQWKSQQKNFGPLLEEIDGKLSTIKKIVITGGEPFLSSNTKLLIDRIVSSQYAKKITVRFFSNISTLPDWLPKLLSSVEKVEIYMSIDGSRDFTSYIRYPLTWSQTKTNIKLLCGLTEKHDNLELRVHSVLQALNIFNIESLIEDLEEFKQYFPYIPSFTLLESPSCLSVNALPKEIKEVQIEKLVKKLDKVETEQGSELNTNKELLSLLLQDIAKKEAQENDFFDFLVYMKKFDEHRKQSFGTLIPSLSKWEKK